MLPATPANGDGARQATGDTVPETNSARDREIDPKLILESIRNDFRRKTARVRAALRIVETKDFAVAFVKATPVQRAEVVSMTSPRAVREWLAKVMEHPLSSLSYRALRELAKRNHIPNYCRVEKDELVKQLELKGVNARQLEEGRDIDRRNEEAPAVSGNPGASDHNADDGPG